MLKSLGRLVGKWTTEATHPALPGVVVHGTATMEWLEGEKFLIQRARSDHPDFPDSISIIGFTDRGRAEDTSSAKSMEMHYYDSRGVSRVYGTRIDDDALQLWRDDPQFAQRFRGTFTDGGDALGGTWQVCDDGKTWKDDLQITYRRQRA